MQRESQRNFRILGQLGRGRHGVVYLARPLGAGMSEEVVVELVEGKDVAWFDAVARKARRIREAEEPVLLLEYAPAWFGDTRWGMVREFFEGASLDQILRARIALPTGVVVAIIGQVARALTRSGIPHGELDPSYVCMSPGGEVRLEGSNAYSKLPPTGDLEALGKILQRLVEVVPQQDPLRGRATRLAREMRDRRLQMDEVFERCREIAEAGPAVSMARLGTLLQPLAVPDVHEDKLSNRDLKEIPNPHEGGLGRGPLPFQDDEDDEEDPSAQTVIHADLDLDFDTGGMDPGEETVIHGRRDEVAWLREQVPAPQARRPGPQSVPPAQPRVPTPVPLQPPPQQRYTMPAYAGTLDPPTGAAGTPLPAPTSARAPEPEGGGGVVKLMGTVVAGTFGLVLGLGAIAAILLWVWSMSGPTAPTEPAAPPGARIAVKVGQGVLCTFKPGNRPIAQEGVTLHALDERTWFLQANLPAAIPVGVVDLAGNRASFTLDASPVATEATLSSCTRAPLEPVRVPRGSEVSLPAGLKPALTYVANPALADVGAGKIDRSVSVRGKERGATSIAAADGQGGRWVRILVVE